MKSENMRQAVSTEIWLEYFNGYLYEKGVITETEKNKMAHLIHLNCRTPNNQKTSGA